MSKSYSIKNLLKHRSIWMAAAILLVLFFHAESEVGFPRLSFLSKFGHYGVDIFFYASGIGCWYSLSKDPETASFFWRRVRRIMPVFLTFIVIWSAFQIIVSQMPASSILGNAVGVEFFRKSSKWNFNWYISGMWISYLLAPLFYSAVKILSTPKNVLVLLFLYILTIPFIGYVQYLIILTRLPIFYLGFLTAKSAENGESATPMQIVITDVIAIIGIILTGVLYNSFPEHKFDWGLGWYPAIAVVPGICITVSVIFDKIAKTKLYKIFSVIGKYTFEIYLVHVFLFEFILAKYPIPTNYKTELLAYAVSFIGAFILNRLAYLLTKLFIFKKQTA
ncbi:MAG: acyltransferase [Firmicutes bacterium]|nr:acyltransferase [Bacillota bacterium]